MILLLGKCMAFLYSDTLVSTIVSGIMPSCMYDRPWIQAKILKRNLTDFDHNGYGCTEWLSCWYGTCLLDLFF